MKSGRDKRRLVAILAADIVGYSRLMGADESGSLAQLKTHRKELIDPIIEENEGRIFKTTGDGLLVEFPSAVGAVRCAAEVQKGMEERNYRVPEDRRVRFRIGVNVGDVIVEGEDLFGDGVNVAARLEGLAEPGGICVSSRVHDDVRGKLDLEFRGLGEQTLKNIERPVQAFAVLLTSEPSFEGPKLSTPEKPSIAILPFTNMSGDPEQEYFSDGITEDLITELSRFRWFFVIARNSTFAYKGKSPNVTEVARELGVRYVLEGSVRKAGSRVRITAQLLDASTGHHLWAERYDRNMEDIFELQDEIASTIAGKIGPELSKAELQRVKTRRSENMDAWDTYLRGMSHLYRYSKDDIAAAQKLFEQAIEAGPDFVAAHVGLAEAHYYEGVYGFSESLKDAGTRALVPAKRAVELGPDDPEVHSTLGRVLYLQREHEPAIRELRTAIELNPNLALAHYGLGAALAFSGQAEEALQHLNMAIRLSPHDPNMGSFLVRLADASIFMHHYDQAVEWAKKAVQRTGFQWSRHAALISALGHLELEDEARRALDVLLNLRPDFSLTFIRQRHLIDDPVYLEHYIDGLRKAGAPD